MEHSFNVEVAKRYGVTAAIFIHSLYFWIAKNEANGRHYYDGKSWTYNSLSALTKLFPYFTKSQIRTVISKCESEGAVIKGNFNKAGYDKTCWYALGDEVLEIYGGYADSSTWGMPDLAQPMLDFAHPCAKSSTPIPVTIPVINKKYIRETQKKFQPPTVFEVRDYCQEKGYHVDPDAFVDYYSARGWKMGKNSMKDWKAAVRYWERNDRGGSANTAGGYGEEMTRL